MRIIAATNATKQGDTKQNNRNSRPAEPEKGTIDNIFHTGPFPILDTLPRRIDESVRDFSPKADPRALVDASLSL